MDKLRLDYVRDNPWVIKEIQNPHEFIQMAAVEADGWTLAYIKNPSEEVQKAAVNSSPGAIRFIENPSEELQLNAVKSEWETGYQIKKPTKNTITTAGLLSLDIPLRIIEEFTVNPGDKSIQQRIVRINGLAIKYISLKT